jgi:hypothetical protein
MPPFSSFSTALLPAMSAIIPAGKLWQNSLLMTSAMAWQWNGISVPKLPKTAFRTGIES